MNREIPATVRNNPYGQSWDGLAEFEEELKDLEPENEAESAFVDPSDDDAFFGFDGDSDDDDDDLLAALDEALDEVEAEARVEFARSLACPDFDALELIPMADTAYRRAILAFMGVREGPRAPRYSQLVLAYAVSDPQLAALLQENLHRSRAYVERRRAEICWVA